MYRLQRSPCHLSHIDPVNTLCDVDLTDDSLITVVAVRSVLARLGANVRAQMVPEATVCLSL